ncbi:hypothetical protein [Shinella zoogloeoides]|uniref:GtrA family protein n=1 Tax=Shinella zoogloeoides TaxID=352475 RepID=A0A6N8TJU2_SHIZO|nr:hypothetical protein [Shinella zoogloeoides]MXO01380.1 hypothetical protein [Shinella zoogloeoides]UEX81524.1 hypothetical protein K8M09_18500 [Shinella zoogloeoides]
MSKSMPAALPLTPSKAPARRQGLTAGVLALYSLVAIALVLAISLPFATDYVGADNDDTMRLVVVRDLLAGQSWFDTTQYRLGLDGGTLMHWSRFVDLPIANLISFFSLFADQRHAEAIALAVWPALLVVPVLAGMGLAAYRLGGTMGMHATLVLTSVFVVALNRFQPGSIDHHNVQLALVAGIAAMLLDPGMRARDHAVAGLLSGLAIAIGAETTPLIGAVCLVVALRWVWQGPAYREAAAAFGLSLALTITLAFFATVAPSRYTQVTCDSLSYGFYALATLGGGTLFLTASLASGRSLRGRLAALAGAGVVIAGAVLVIAPGCLANPLDTLDPLLKTFWLSGVIEAQSAVAQFRLEPGSVGSFYAPGLLAMLVCLWRIRRGEKTEAHLVVLALLAVAFAVSLIQIRGAIFSNMLSALPLGLAIADMRKASNADPKNLRTGLAFIALTLASVPATWALAGAMLPGRSQAKLTAGLAAAPTPRLSCTAEASIAPLAAEPAGVVAGASNLGAPILRYTGHRVLSAPYHRNQGGMLTELHIGLSNPRQAEAFLRGAHVTLLAFCPDDTQTRDLAKAEPGGLYADLLKGRVPDYLEPIAGTESASLRLYRVRPE